ncbi:MAG: hypothetical protein GW748_04525 [Alphaproteobacteria bacterium]|nr:hypothetical protein [Alphaproteobacteria bacterium]NCQ66989.1 hypothetical protein [Alphaproteobacteria bacterium]NCT07586.1 hypothetical protein [Alphaproteobacteria bacterium]
MSLSKSLSFTLITTAFLGIDLENQAFASNQIIPQSEKELQEKTSTALPTGSKILPHDPVEAARIKEILDRLDEHKALLEKQKEENKNDPHQEN